MSDVAEVGSKEAIDETVARSAIQPFIRKSKELAVEREVGTQAVQQAIHRGVLFSKKSPGQFFNWVLDEVEVGRELAHLDHRVRELRAENELLRGRNLRTDQLIESLKAQILPQKELNRWSEELIESLRAQIALQAQLLNGERVAQSRSISGADS